MSEIAIELKQQEFAPGDRVEGEVVLTLDRDTPVRGVRLLLEGFEKSRWREGSGKHRHTHSETRNLFKEEVTFYGRPRLGAGELFVDTLRSLTAQESYDPMRAGTYRYGFRYQLPADLPGDYTSSLSQSRICYTCRAQADLPLRVDLEAIQPLVILERSGDAAATQPVTQRQTKTFLFDSDSSIEAAVHLDKDTFAVGEMLRCQLEVSNRAPNKELRSATVSLIQVESLRAQGHARQPEAEVGRTTFDDLRFPFKDRKTVALSYQIPPDLYPTITSGTLVKLNYELSVRLEIPWAVDAKLRVPIRLCGSSAGKSTGM